MKVVRKYQDESSILRSSFYAKSIGRFKNDFLKKLPCTTTKRTIGRLLIFERCFATQYDWPKQDKFNYSKHPIHRKVTQMFNRFIWKWATTQLTSRVNFFLMHVSDIIALHLFFFQKLKQHICLYYTERESTKWVGIVRVQPFWNVTKFGQSPRPLSFTLTGRVETGTETCCHWAASPHHP